MVKSTAIVSVDMWKTHWCKTVVRKVRRLAEVVNAMLWVARQSNISVVHTSRNVAKLRKGQECRRRTLCCPSCEVQLRMGKPIIPGACMCLEERCFRHRGPRNYELVTSVCSSDFLIRDGVELHSVCQHHGIQNLFYLGSAANVCMWVRTFGCRSMRELGYNCTIVRDLSLVTCRGPRARERVFQHVQARDIRVESSSALLKRWRASL